MQFPTHTLKGAEMHKFHVRFTGQNEHMNVDITLKLTAASYADAESAAYRQITALFVPTSDAPELDIRAIHIGECEAGCL